MRLSAQRQTCCLTYRIRRSQTPHYTISAPILYNLSENVPGWGLKAGWSGERSTDEGDELECACVFPYPCVSVSVFGSGVVASVASVAG
jgi:hypothetical protein